MKTFQGTKGKWELGEYRNIVINKGGLTICHEVRQVGHLFDGI